MRGRSDQGDRIENCWTSWKRVEKWREIDAGVETAMAGLGDPTAEVVREAKQRQPV